MELVYLTSGPRERVLSAILDAGHEVNAVVVTDPQRWPKVQGTIDVAERRGIPIHIGSRGRLDDIAPLVRGRVGLSAGFAYILPKAVIAEAETFLNVHGTLLPKYRGARTLNWVLANGETETGVTVHSMDEGVDTGPILLQRAFPLSRFESAVSLARKTYEFEPDVVLEALAMLEGGTARFEPQEPIDVPQCPDRTPEHSQIDPSRPLSESFDAIRAADPDNYPAYFFHEGERVCIRMWRPDKPDEEHDLI